MSKIILALIYALGDGMNINVGSTVIHKDSIWIVSKILAYGIVLLHVESDPSTRTFTHVSKLAVI